MKGKRQLDITGNRYWKLTVVGFSHEKNGHYYWDCQCACGKSVVVDGGDIKSGHTTSCGCFRLQRQIEVNTRHGLTNHRLHGIWEGIKTRIFNKKSVPYKNYGGRGIKLCKEWMDFIKFYVWAMENGYEDPLTIERIDVDGDYEPGNCKWIPRSEQSKNRRNTKKYAHI